jgi:LPXTG-motif cell wall-anchored protein
MNDNKSLIARFELIQSDMEEIPEEDVPGSAVIKEPEDIKESEEIIPDETGVPKGAATLPKTGGIPMEALMGLGAALMAGGFFLRKKGKKEDSDNQ